MKKLLKFVLIPVLAAQPTMLVVACGTTTQDISDQDILNLAVGRMTNHTFNMSSDLGLTVLPAKDTTYANLSTNVKTRIDTYFSDLVKNGTLNWGYQTVDVQISAKPSNKFEQKYTDKVEDRIVLTTTLAYKNLPPEHKDIVVKINNDLSTGQQKIDAIGGKVKDYFNGTTAPNPFALKSLYPDKLTVAQDKYTLAQISANLRTYLFKSPDNDVTPPIIDVAGIDISVHNLTGGSSTDIINQLDDNALNTAAKTITGAIKNLQITLTLKNGGFSNSFTTNDLTNQNNQIKYYQTFEQSGNQIAGLLLQGPETYKFANADLPGGKVPTDNQQFSAYDSGGTLKGKVLDSLFNTIKPIYPVANMGADWKVDCITIINNGDSSFFKMNPKSDNKSGYFLININFKLINGADTLISTSVSGIKLNLSGNAPD